MVPLEVKNLNHVEIFYSEIRKWECECNECNAMWTYITSAIYRALIRGNTAVPYNKEFSYMLFLFIL